ncbi:MAG: helix-turn-helix domain-containing protein [Terriglobia bacterium]
MANSVPRAFGLRVRAFRVKAGYSQEELAARSGLHRTFIGRIERGETNITLINIHRVAHGLGVAPSALFGEMQH